MNGASAFRVLAAAACLAAAAPCGVRAEGNPPVVEEYRRLMMEPTEAHLLDAAIAAVASVPDERTVEFLRRHQRETERTVLVLDGVEYSDAEMAYQCLEFMVDVPIGGRVKGIVSRWVGDAPFRLHLVEISAEDAARCDAQAQVWLEGFRAGRAADAPGSAGTEGEDEGENERENRRRGYEAGRVARALAGEVR